MTHGQKTRPMDTRHDSYILHMAENTTSVCTHMVSPRDCLTLQSCLLSMSHVSIVSYYSHVLSHVQYVCVMSSILWVMSSIYSVSHVSIVSYYSHVLSQGPTQGVTSLFHGVECILHWTSVSDQVQISEHVRKRVDIVHRLHILSRLQYTRPYTGSHVCTVRLYFALHTCK